MVFNQKKIFLGAISLIILIGVFGGGFYLGRTQAVIKISAPPTVDFSLFWDAYNKLQEHFISPEKIDNQKVTYGAIAGMTKSLGDPYTAFFDPDQAKVFNSDLAGSFDGIGMEVSIKKEQLTVVTSLKGSPAQKAGVKSGDIIVKINGKSTADMTSEDAVNLIRGKKGTQVTLTLFRDGFKDAQDFKITRATIKIPSIDWELKNGNVAYIHMYQFDQTLSGDFQKIAYQILQSPAKKVVLDLRDNPGGYLDTAQEVAGWFLPSGQVVTIEDFGKDKPRQEYKADGNGAFASYPMVVLMNKGSASASEILAGALRDNRKIQLVGEKSFGKGSVQEVIQLKDGQSFLKITIAKWLTPKGNSISEVGLTPDVKVENTDADTAAKKDPQLDKALEILGH